MSTTTMEQPVKELRPMELPPLPENPLVSVLIANYNYARYLPEALDSLLAQTYTNWEAIVCDDGSTDNSRQVILDYARRDLRFRYVFKENGGVASALNAAFAESRGEIVCLLDADDVYAPSKLTKIVELARNKPAAGLLSHCLQMVHERNGKKVGPVPLSFDEGWVGDQIIATGRWVKVAWGSGVSLRSEVAKKVFPIPEQLRSVADLFLMLAASVLTEIAVAPEMLVCYRVHGANLTNSSLLEFGADRSLRPYFLAIQAHAQFVSSLTGRPPARPEQYLQFRYALLTSFATTGTVPNEYFRGTALDLLHLFPRGYQQMYWSLLLRLPRRLSNSILRLHFGYYPGKRYLKPLAGLIGAG